MKNKYHIAIGISAGIAAYKIVDLIKSLKNNNIKVSVIMTKNAVKMFGTEMFENASRNKVDTSIIPENFKFREVLKDKKVEHIALADSLDLLLIAPATADIIAKIVSGIADDYLTTLVLSVTCPVFIAPSMNTNMWQNPATRKNLNTVKNLGYYLISPDNGLLACGYEGIGRLKNVTDLENNIINFLEKRNTLNGKKILITAGGTSVAIDSVRSITNRASGKMGKSLAQAAFKRGAEVLLLRSQNSVRPDFRIPEETFNTVRELSLLLTKYSPLYDIIFHSASVSDFNPSEDYKGKLDSGKVFHLTLNPGEKLINKIKILNQNAVLIGFKAEINIREKDIINISGKLMNDSQADYVIINDVGRSDIGFASDYNEVYMVSSDGKQVKLKKDTKDNLAEKILDLILE